VQQLPVFVMAGMTAECECSALRREGRVSQADLVHLSPCSPSTRYAPPLSMHSARPLSTSTLFAASSLAFSLPSLRRTCLPLISTSPSIPHRRPITVLSGAIWTPMDVMKARLQKGNEGTSATKLLKKIWREEGYKGVWRGYWLSNLVFV